MKRYLVPGPDRFVVEAFNPDEYAVVEEWTCPHHDAPPDVDEIPDEVVKLAELAHAAMQGGTYFDDRTADTIIEAVRAVGLCCRDSGRWRDKKTPEGWIVLRERGMFEAIMEEYARAHLPFLRESSSGSILLAELLRPRDPDAPPIRIPIVVAAGTTIPRSRPAQAAWRGEADECDCPEHRE